MNHADLIDAGCAVKYEGQDVPQFAMVECYGDAMARREHIHPQVFKKLLALSCDGYEDVMYVYDWSRARRAARKERGL